MSDDAVVRAKDIGVSSPTESKIELVIVGAGPVGLYAAHYAAFRSLRFVVLESMPMVGGQITAFYPDQLLYDVPGFPEIRGDELVAQLRNQAHRFDVDIRLQTHVEKLERSGDGIRLELRREAETCSGVAQAWAPAKIPT